MRFFENFIAKFKKKQTIRKIPHTVNPESNRSMVASALQQFKASNPSSNTMVMQKKVDFKQNVANTSKVNSSALTNELLTGLKKSRKETL